MSGWGSIGALLNKTKKKGMDEPQEPMGEMSEEKKIGRVKKGSGSHPENYKPRIYNPWRG